MEKTARRVIAYKYRSYRQKEGGKLHSDYRSKPDTIFFLNKTIMQLNLFLHIYRIHRGRLQNVTQELRLAKALRRMERQNLCTRVYA